MWVSTFHSACVRILRRDAEQLGYPSTFSIYDQADAVRLTGYVARDLGLDTKKFVPRSVHSHISNLKNELVSTQQALDKAEGVFDRKIAEIYEEYQRRLRNSGAMDFDDLLNVTVELFSTHPHTLNHYQERFQHVLVDEYQDTNPAQNDIVLKLGDKHQNVFVVGDSDQSVYAFRGADIQKHPRIRKSFPRHQRRHTRSELSIHPNHPRRCQLSHLQQLWTQTQRPLDRQINWRQNRPLPSRRRS